VVTVLEGDQHGPIGQIEAPAEDKAEGLHDAGVMVSQAELTQQRRKVDETKHTTMEKRYALAAVLATAGD
jgi:hypothetical protein